MRQIRPIHVAFVLMAIALFPGRADADVERIRTVLLPLVEEILPTIRDAGGPVAVPRFLAPGGEPLGVEEAFTAGLISLLESNDIEARDPHALSQITEESAVMEAVGEGPSSEKAAGAVVMVVGQLAVLDDVLIVDLKVLDVATGEVKAASEGRTDLADFGSTPDSVVRTAPTGDTTEVLLRRLTDEFADELREALPEGLRYVRLAVVDFENSGDGARRRELGKVVAAEAATVLRRDHGALLVERGRLGQLLDEQALGLTGMVEPSTAAELGALLGADVFVLGDVSEIGDRYRVNMRAVSTEDASLLAVAQTSIPASGLIALSADAVVLRSRSGALFRSVLIPGWGQIYNRQSAKGGMVMGVEALVIGSAVGFHFLGMRDERAYDRVGRGDVSSDDGVDLSQRAEDLRLQAESNYRMRNWLLVGAGVVWLYNVVDAAANGRPASSDWTGSGLVLAPMQEGEGTALTLVGSW